MTNRRFRKFRLDGRQLDRLYRDHARQILGYFVRRTFDREIALDLLAETFAEAFTDRAAFRGSTEEDAVGWLFGIARHQLASYYRRGEAEDRALRRLGVERPEWLDEDIERLEELAEIATLQRELASHLGELTEDHRRAIELRVVQELSYPEIASELGVSEQVVRARVSRGLRSLHDLLTIETLVEERRGR